LHRLSSSDDCRWNVELISRRRSSSSASASRRASSVAPPGRVVAGMHPYASADEPTTTPPGRRPLAQSSTLAHALRATAPYGEATCRPCTRSRQRAPASACSTANFCAMSARWTPPRSMRVVWITAPCVCSRTVTAFATAFAWIASRVARAMSEGAPLGVE